MCREERRSLLWTCGESRLGYHHDAKPVVTRLRLLNFQHAIQCHARPVLDLIFHFDLIDNVAFD